LACMEQSSQSSPKHRTHRITGRITRATHQILRFRARSSFSRRINTGPKMTKLKSQILYRDLRQLISLKLSTISPSRSLLLLTKLLKSTTINLVTRLAQMSKLRKDLSPISNGQIVRQISSAQELTDLLERLRKLSITQT